MVVKVTGIRSGERFRETFNDTCDDITTIPGLGSIEYKPNGAVRVKLVEDVESSKFIRLYGAGGKRIGRIPVDKTWGVYIEPGVSLRYSTWKGKEDDKFSRIRVSNLMPRRPKTSKS